MDLLEFMSEEEALLYQDAMTVAKEEEEEGGQIFDLIYNRDSINPGMQHIVIENMAELIWEEE